MKHNFPSHQPSHWCAVIRNGTLEGDTHKRVAVAQEINKKTLTKKHESAQSKQRTRSSGRIRPPIR
jgi:hypothetical protein